MKKILSLLLLLLAFSSQSLFAQAAIKFEQTSHDFGSFLEKETQHYVFKFTNTGNEPLVIHQAITSCGCTVANFTKTPIEPGKTLRTFQENDYHSLECETNNRTPFYCRKYARRSWRKIAYLYFYDKYNRAQHSDQLILKNSKHIYIYKWVANTITSL